MKIFGKKNQAMFDKWSLGHILFYYGFTKFLLLPLNFWYALLIVLVIGFIWEVVEIYLENSPNQWFDEKEIWHNRFIGDFLSNLSGFLLGWFF